jgi:hypothetical protein
MIACPQCGTELENFLGMGGHARHCNISKEQLFWAKVDKSGGPQACWNWIASKKPRGYGQFHYQGKMHRAHRLAWSLTHSDPGKLSVCHTCDNIICCNPAHLYAGTHKQNMMDKCLRGRVSTKLTRDDVREIKRLIGTMPNVEIAAKFNVGGSVISEIKLGHKWSYVK